MDTDTMNDSVRFLVEEPWRVLTGVELSDWRTLLRIPYEVISLRTGLMMSTIELVESPVADRPLPAGAAVLINATLRTEQMTQARALLKRIQDSGGYMPGSLPLEQHRAIQAPLVAWMRTANESMLTHTTGLDTFATILSVLGDMAAGTYNEAEEVFTVHELRTHPQQCQEIAAGLKTFDVRKNDRDFKVGHVLLLRGWNPDEQRYTGWRAVRRVSLVQSGFGLHDGYVVLGLTGVNDRVASRVLAPAGRIV